MKPQFIGVGVGPGDPGLITLKAAQKIREADVISYIANESGRSQARSIAFNILQDRQSSAIEIPVVMPMCEDRAQANRVYDQAAEAIQNAIDNGKCVVFLCEGDPLFFGSFSYLLQRLQGCNCCEVVPGISSVHAAAATLAMPLTMLSESFAVVSGRHSSSKLEATLRDHDSVVVMKAGKSRQKILNALAATGRSHDASYLEYIGREGEHVVDDMSRLHGESGPYFSLFLVVRQARVRSC